MAPAPLGPLAAEEALVGGVLLVQLLHERVAPHLARRLVAEASLGAFLRRRQPRLVVLVFLPGTFL